MMKRGDDMNQRMKDARSALGWSQETLAKKVLVSRQTILLIEQGDYNPSLNLCRLICLALGKTLNDLFWEESLDE
jgi:putative transcriptional regulator